MATTLETIETVLSTGNTVIIYNNRKPDVYPYSEIYDPDNPQSGKVFPSLQSLIIREGSLWYVSDRDESTFRVTLKPITFIETDSYTDKVKIISYGNDKFCVYQDKRTSPYKLVVDAKLLFYGNNLVEYALYRENTDKTEECISMYLDATDTFVSNRIPMQKVSEDYAVYKWPTNCHTTKDLVEGEPLTLRVFNNLGNVAAEITVFVRNAVWNNDLSSHTNPIVGMGATSLQMIGDDFYIYAKQDPSHLNIRPYLKYADGTIVFVPIDNQKCFMYGLDDFIPDYPGHSQELLFKYFLSRREQAMHPETVNGTQFVTCTKKMVVTANTNDYDVKITTIPVYHKLTKVWSLRFFCYTDRRDAVYDVTHLVNYGDKPFNGRMDSWGVMQHLEIELDLQTIFDTDAPVPVVQTIYVTVYDPSNYERYFIKDNANDDHVYGADGSVTRRPVIHYDETEDQYFIPTSIFRNWDAVVESFYHLARPPFNPTSETEAPTPTHFTIRDPYTGNVIIASPIAADQYGQLWPTYITTENYVDMVLIVEFLQEINGEYQLLYGVPVDVKRSATGYNTATNNIQP